MKNEPIGGGGEFLLFKTKFSLLGEAKIKETSNVELDKRKLICDPTFCPASVPWRKMHRSLLLTSPNMSAAITNHRPSIEKLN